MKTRRAFVQSLAIPFIGYPLIKHSHLNFSTDKVLRVALLGLGSYAERVAEAMQGCSRAKITGLISGTPEKLTKWSEKYGVKRENCFSYDEIENIKDREDIDAVYIITPNSLHKPFAERVARSKKHVISEKPMALNAQEGEAMIRVCQEHGVRLLVGYRMHFEAITQEVVKRQRSGEFGRTLFFQGLSGFRIGDPSQWRLNAALAGGGAMMDIGIYSINGARYMLGEEPIWVTAQETKTDPIKFKEGVDETISFQMGFPSGAIASCLSTYSLNNLDKFFLNGTKGYAEMQPSTGYGPIKGRTHLGEIKAEHKTHQMVQMDNFAAILLDGEKPLIPVDGEEGLKDMKIIDAIYRAVKSGKKEIIKI